MILDQTRVSEFWRIYTDELIGGLDANKRLSSFTRNTDLIGAFAEASVKSLAQKMSAPYRTSNGSICSLALYDAHQKNVEAGGDGKGTLKQLDLLVWNPSPTPAIFDQSGFSLVSWQSVLGALEIKRTAYSGVGTKMTDTLNWVEEHVDGDIKPGLVSQTKNEKKIVLQDPNWIGLGVICIREYGSKTDSALNELVRSGRTVILMEENADGELRTNVSHVIHLVNFLANARRRAEAMLSINGVNVTAIAEHYENEQPPGLLRKPGIGK